MKTREEGQGLVEYALILVLVSIVVIAVLLLLGPAIDDVFCEIVHGMDETYVCGPYTTVSVATTMDSGQQPPLEWDDAKEKILALWEQAKAQEEGLQEGADLALEAAVEGFEVLTDYADDLNQQQLSASLSLLIQNIQSGEIDALPDGIVDLGAYVEDIPLEVWTAVAMKMEPSLTDSCEVLASGLVSQDAIDAAWQALDQLDPDHAGAEEAEDLLQQAVGIIDDRNSFIEQWLESVCGY